MVFDIATVQFTSGAWAGYLEGEEYVYRFFANCAPMKTVDGRKVLVEGKELELLTNQLGFQTRVEGELRYPIAEDGGSPSIVQVSQDQTTYIAQAAATYAQWIGKTVELSIT